METRGAALTPKLEYPTWQRPALQANTNQSESLKSFYLVDYFIARLFSKQVCISDDLLFQQNVLFLEALWNTLKKKKRKKKSPYLLVWCQSGCRSIELTIFVLVSLACQTLVICIFFIMNLSSARVFSDVTHWSFPNVKIHVKCCFSGFYVGIASLFHSESLLQSSWSHTVKIRIVWSHSIEWMFKVRANQWRCKILKLCCIAGNWKLVNFTTRTGNYNL